MRQKPAWWAHVAPIQTLPTDLGYKTTGEVNTTGNKLYTNLYFFP